MAEIHNTLTYVCSSGDYCDLEYTKYQLQWLFDIDFTKIDAHLRNVVHIQQNHIDKSTMCYSNGEAQQCPSNLCQTVSKGNELTTHCVDTMKKVRSTMNIPGLNSIKSIDASTSFGQQRSMNLLESLGQIDPSTLFNLLGSLGQIDLSSLSNLPGLLGQINPSLLPNLLGLLSDNGLSDSSDIMNLINQFLLPTPPSIVKPSPSINDKATIIIVDTIITNFTLSKEDSESVRTISYRCTMNLCNHPSNFTVIKKTINMNYNTTRMLRSLVKHNDTAKESTPSSIVSKSTIPNTAYHSNETNFIPMMIFATIYILYYLTIDY
ncbi:hypothetical protein I4U23_015359 [Adineta vaga]|nr:hypothetical protein I4U23_015359 [Adineta vaga]